MKALDLLPRGDLVKTGDVDHADWNYEGILGWVSRQRYHLVRRLLPRSEVGTLLEVGYGSGVFLPELKRHAAGIYAVDVHDRNAQVETVLRSHGVDAALQTAPAENLPFPDESFDVVVAVSTFEFVSDAAKAAREINRVLKRDGIAIVVTPGSHPILDFALSLGTGESAAHDFGERRQAVVPSLLAELKHERSLYFPAKIPFWVYRALRLRKLKAA